jgi:hypothetical protein
MLTPYLLSHFQRVTSLVYPLLDLMIWVHEKGQGRLFVEGSEPTVASSQAYAERYHPTFRGP